MQISDFHSLKSFCAHEKMLPQFVFFFVQLFAFCQLVFICEGFSTSEQVFMLKSFSKKKSKLEIALIPSIYTTTYLIFNIIIAAYVWDKQVRECISIAFMTVYDQSISMFWRPLICLKIKAQAYIMLTICLILGDFSAQICLQSLCL